MVLAIIEELEQRHQELEDPALTSIYFGGGTPSLLTDIDLGSILEAFAKYFDWQPNTEITLEANPDDLTKDKLAQLRSAGINRLSVGIQSFDETDLQFMNRAHNATEAATCLDLAKAHGFELLTADLIYGSPTTSDAAWERNIDHMLSYDIPHISAYCLTVEEGTALHHQVKVGKSQPVDMEKSVRQFELLMDKMSSAGYEHYEISNFAKHGYRAVHNTNYWQGRPYLGLGPAAHSYDGKNVRRWNVANNAKYMKAVRAKEQYWESETLTTKDQYNEYVLTGLRTSWGLDISILSEKYADQWQEAKSVMEQLQSSGLLQLSGNQITLTREGKLLADHVSMQLFAD